MICKKVTRAIIPLLICVIFVFSSAPSSKADTIQAHGTATTSYGSYTWSAQQAASTLPVTISLPFVGISFPYNSGTSFSIDYSLKNQYSGVITVTVTGNNTWSVDNVNILTSGCNLDSLPSDHASYKTSHSFNLRLKNSDKFSFVIYGAGSTVFLGSTSVNLYHNVSVDNLEQQIDATLDLYMPGMSTSLSNLYTGIGYDGNSSTSLQADTLAYDISVIKTYIDGIEGYLSAGNSYVDQLEGYVDNLEAQLNDLININKIIARPLYQQSALLWALSYGELNYDNLFPSFVYSTSNNNSAYTAANRLCVAPNSTYSLYIYTINTLGANSWNIYMRGSDSPVTSTRIYAFTPPSTQYYLYRFDFTNNSSAHVYFEIEFLNNVTIMPLFYGNKNNVPDDIHYLFGDDLNNTYTRLLQQIATGIGNISQQQIIENNTNINNYNNYQTSINNVENNYYQEFNTYETNIEQNNTFDFTGLSSDGITVYHNLFTSVFQIDLIKWPLLITLLGLIIVIILG